MLKLTAELQDWLIEKNHAPAGKTPGEYLDAARRVVESGDLPIDQYATLIGVTPKGKKAMNANLSAGPSVTDIANSASGGSGGAGVNVRVKRASERYSSKSHTVVNQKTGQPLVVFGSPVETPSAQTYARCGAWFKHMLTGAGNAAMLRKWGLKVPELDEHEKSLVAEVVHEGYWCGETNSGRYIDKKTIDEIGGLSTKALLEDSTSGGSGIVPYEFDAAIATIPYLYGQLLPYVDLRTCSSNDVKTARMGQVTVSWGTSEGTAISLFNTDSLITNIDIPIVPVSAAIEWGKDLQADTPVADFGQMLIDQFGQATLKELDRVIVLGNGTTQPEGFTVCSGTTAINSDNGTGGAMTFNDCLKAIFALGLQFRQMPLNISYVSNDTTYQRSRQVRVDPHSLATTVNQTPLFGLNVESYETLGYPHRINNSIGNSTMAMVALKGYRLYRRTGLDVFLVEQDFTLARQNKRGAVIRQRVGGKLIQPTACAIMADCQS